MRDLQNPVTGQTRTFTDSQARWYRNRGWTEPGKEETVAEVKDRVGDDPDLARTALAAEEARDNPRSTLVEHLRLIIEPE